MDSQDATQVQCPYCMQWVEFYVDPGTEGELVEDCEVCCRPWRVFVTRSGSVLHVDVTRAQ